MRNFTKGHISNNFEKKMFNCNGEESVYELYIYYIYTYIYTFMRRKKDVSPPPTRVQSAFCSVLFQLVLTQYVSLTGEV